MKTLILARRTAREILRDPLTVIFGLGFPLILLFLLTAIQRNVPVALFTLESLTPGVAVFGQSFITLFAATLIARDRSSSFLQRLYTTPLAAGDYILGYALPLLPMGLAQSAACYLAALCLGLPATVHVLWALLAALPAGLFFIGLGLLAGTVLTDRQVGGLCGALLTNLTAWLSGTWFDLSLVGGWFEDLARALPFLHAVQLGRAALRGEPAGGLDHLWPVAGFAMAALIAAAAVFAAKMRRD